MNVTFDHYTGFEGEAETIFKSADGKWTIDLWEGYMSSMMKNIPPNAAGMWESLALLYHTCTGWYANSPFELTEVDEALRQLKTYPPDFNELGSNLQVYTDLLFVFEYAAQNKQSIIAEYS